MIMHLRYRFLLASKIIATVSTCMLIMEPCGCMPTEINRTQRHGTAKAILGHHIILKTLSDNSSAVFIAKNHIRIRRHAKRLKSAFAEAEKTLPDITLNFTLSEMGYLPETDSDSSKAEQNSKEEYDREYVIRKRRILLTTKFDSAVRNQANVQYQYNPSNQQQQQQQPQHGLRPPYNQPQQQQQQQQWPSQQGPQQQIPQGGNGQQPHSQLLGPLSGPPNQQRYGNFGPNMPQHQQQRPIRPGQVPSAPFADLQQHQQQVIQQKHLQQPQPAAQQPPQQLPPNTGMNPNVETNQQQLIAMQQQLLHQATPPPPSPPPATEPQQISTEAPAPPPPPPPSAPTTVHLETTSTPIPSPQSTSTAAKQLPAPTTEFATVRLPSDNALVESERIVTEAGDQIALHCANDPALQILWRDPDGADLTSQILANNNSNFQLRTNNDLVIVNVRKQDFGIYKCYTTSDPPVMLTAMEVVQTTCADKPCKNGGQCVEVLRNATTGFESLKCVCPFRYHGHRCEIKRNLFLLAMPFIAAVMIAGMLAKALCGKFLHSSKNSNDDDDDDESGDGVPLIPRASINRASGLPMGVVANQNKTPKRKRSSKTMTEKAAKKSPPATTGQNSDSEVPLLPSSTAPVSSAKPLVPKPPQPERIAALQTDKSVELKKRFIRQIGSDDVMVPKRGNPRTSHRSKPPSSSPPADPPRIHSVPKTFTDDADPRTLPSKSLPSLPNVARAPPAARSAPVQTVAEANRIFATRRYADERENFAPAPRRRPARHRRRTTYSESSSSTDDDGPARRALYRHHRYQRIQSLEDVDDERQNSLRAEADISRRQQSHRKYPRDRPLYDSMEQNYDRITHRRVDEPERQPRYENHNVDEIRQVNERQDHHRTHRRRRSPVSPPRQPKRRHARRSSRFDNDVQVEPPRYYEEISKYKRRKPEERSNYPPPQPRYDRRAAETVHRSRRKSTPREFISAPPITDASTTDNDDRTEEALLPPAVIAAAKSDARDNERRASTGAAAQRLAKKSKPAAAAEEKPVKRSSVKESKKRLSGPPILNADTTSTAAESSDTTAASQQQRHSAPPSTTTPATTSDAASSAAESTTSASKPTPPPRPPPPDLSASKKSPSKPVRTAPPIPPRGDAKTNKRSKSSNSAAEKTPKYVPKTATESSKQPKAAAGSKKKTSTKKKSGKRGKAKPSKARRNSAPAALIGAKPDINKYITKGSTIKAARR